MRLSCNRRRWQDQNILSVSFLTVCSCGTLTISLGLCNSQLTLNILSRYKTKHSYVFLNCKSAKIKFCFFSRIVTVKSMGRGEIYFKIKSEYLCSIFPLSLFFFFFFFFLCLFLPMQWINGSHVKPICNYLTTGEKIYYPI